MPRRSREIATSRQKAREGEFRQLSEVCRKGLTIGVSCKVTCPKHPKAGIEYLEDGTANCRKCMREYWRRWDKRVLSKPKEEHPVAYHRGKRTA